jgi:hypothetical protein
MWMIEKLRMQVPHVRRLHRSIDDLQQRLAKLEGAPLLAPVSGSGSVKIDEQFRKFLRDPQPHDIPGFAKRRAGGYVMLDDFDGVQAALSLGIGPEVSWDLDVARRGSRVLQFDHTVESSPQPHPHFVFSGLRVVGRAQDRDDTTRSQILSGAELAVAGELIED